MKINLSKSLLRSTIPQDMNSDNLLSLSAAILAIAAITTFSCGSRWLQAPQEGHLGWEETADGFEGNSEYA